MTLQNQQNITHIQLSNLKIDKDSLIVSRKDDSRSEKYPEISHYLSKLFNFLKNFISYY